MKEKFGLKILKVPFTNAKMAEMTIFNAIPILETV